MDDDLSNLAWQDAVRNEGHESQGERLIGTSNFAKFRGKGALLWPRRRTRQSKSFTIEIGA